MSLILSRVNTKKTKFFFDSNSLSADRDKKILIFKFFQVITSEQSEWWVSVHDILKFLPHPEPNQVWFGLVLDEIS